MRYEPPLKGGFVTKGVKDTMAENDMIPQYT